MKKSTSMLILSVFVVASASWSVRAADWKPAYSDAPVPENEVKAIEAALPESPIVPPTANRRILVVSATRGFRHPSIRHGKIALPRMGEKTGAYEALISDDPANFEPEALAGFDAVLLLSPTQDFLMPGDHIRNEFSNEEWQALQKRHQRLIDNLVAYVRNGGGLMGIHAATDACYNHAEFGETIGAYFDGHPWGAGHSVTIVVEDPDHATMHPVFGNQKDFQLKEEIYQFREKPYSRDRLRVLLHLDPARSDKVEGMKRKDNDYPVAWVQKVGNGRVFYTSIGHNPHIYWDPMMLKHYLAGIQFVAGDLPANTTPSSEK